MKEIRRCKCLGNCPFQPQQNIALRDAPMNELRPLGTPAKSYSDRTDASTITREENSFFLGVDVEDVEACTRNVENMGVVNEV